MNSTVAFSAASFYAFGLLAARLRWGAMGMASMLHLPFAAAFVLMAFVLERHTQPLAHLGWVAWPLAMYAWYDLLWGYERVWPRPLVRYGHAAGLWSMCFIGAWALARGVASWIPDSDTWQFISWGLVPAAMIGALLRWGVRLEWPVRRFESVYFGGASAGLVGFLLLWLLASCFHAGDPHPLAYVPLLNPLELTQGFLLLAAVLWAIRGRRYEIPIIKDWPASYLPGVLAAGIFVVANAVVARAVHHMAGVAFTLRGLMFSALFEAAIAILWGVTALAVMAFASRSGIRQLWFVGAGLLAMLIVKLFLIDLAGTGTVGRIVSFLATGALMLLIGYVSPIPPRTEEARS